jgi:multidrug efflux pump subunit AcrB
MFYFEFVTVKLLPFDNKSEVQVVIDLPEGAALEDTARTGEQIASIARTLPEVTAMELYAGAAAPFNFNGLVRHYYLRDKPEQGDVMVTLLPKSERSRASHDIAVALREKLKALTLPPGSSIKVVETPPGPPVLATLLGEVYGPDPETRRKTAAELERLFKSVPYIVDIDTSYRQERPRLRLVPDRAKLDYYGLSEGEMYDSIGMLMRPKTVGYAARGGGRTPLPITIELPQSARRWDASLASTPIAVARGAGAGRLVELGEVVNASREPGSYYIFRRDGRASDMVTADLAGKFEAPIYGMLAVDRAIDADDWAGKGLAKPLVRLHGQPG